MEAELALIRFVRTLLKVGEAVREDECFTVRDSTASVALVSSLAQSGYVDVAESACRPNERTAAWVRQAVLARGAVPARAASPRPASGGFNRNESPLSRLIAADSSFLSSHHVETGERVRGLVEKAQLRYRVTMSYAPVVIHRSYSNTSAELSDMTVDARRKVSEIYTVLPRDCAGAVVDICGFLKGLHQVESERGWPRRSAKIVLRIGLEQLAQHYGIGELAVGPTRTSTNGWMEGGVRPAMWD